MLKASKNLIKDLKKQRHNSCLLFLDNIKIIKDALKLGIEPKYILIQNDKAGELEPIFSKYQSILYSTDRTSIEMLSDSKTPQGVVCITEYLLDVVVKPETDFLVLDGLQDPGNVGSLIRTACACGINYVYLVDSVNVTNSKLVRSSVGTIFQVKVMQLSRGDFVKFAKSNNLNLIKADMFGENIFNFKKSGKVGVVVGNEGQGVSKAISDICQFSVSLPMKNNVESLNASVSGSIIMYEISKNSFWFIFLYFIFTSLCIYLTFTGLIIYNYIEFICF